MGIAEGTEALLAAKFEVLLSHLDERQRRLVLAAEARVLGHGGIRLVARAAGVREATVSAGIAELESGQAPLGRTRRPGGGRGRVVDTDPGLRPALLALVAPDASSDSGDPPLRWTTKSTRRLAAELTAQGHRVSADTVADLLREEGFSLRGNARTAEGRQGADREAQFRYLTEQIRQHQAEGAPVISVDCRKKEIAGEARNARRVQHAAGSEMFTVVRAPAGGTGWVNVGVDHDTAAFAVDCVRRWWHSAGRVAYPHASRLLITVDAGGSPGYRTRVWPAELAELAARTCLAITVCHFPPGTVHWNRVEHRLVSQITMNWRGRPLTSHEVVVNTIAATATRTGPATGMADAVGAQGTAGAGDGWPGGLSLTRHDVHGDWNYTLYPAAARCAAGGPP